MCCPKLPHPTMAIDTLSMTHVLPVGRLPGLP